MTREYVISKVGEIPEGTHTVVEVRNRQIGVFNINGQYYALPNICPHQRGPLCLGGVGDTVIASEETGWEPVYANEGEIIVCPWHGWEFNIMTGQSLAFPNRKIPTYPVEVRGNDLVLIL